MPTGLSLLRRKCMQNKGEIVFYQTEMKAFTEEDSVIIFNLSETCKKTCYGYAKNESFKLI